MKLVLVVEDEYGTAEVLALVLAGEGYEVQLAFDGHDALRKMAERRPDVVLTDHMMPTMTGAQLSVAMRADPALATIPIVMTSSAEERVVRASHGHFDAYLRKPYSAAKLFALLASVLAGRQNQSAQPTRD